MPNDPQTVAEFLGGPSDGDTLEASAHSEIPAYVRVWRDDETKPHVYVSYYDTERDAVVFLYAPLHSELGGEPLPEHLWLQN